jgi:hypothetical protein
MNLCGIGVDELLVLFLVRLGLWEYMYKTLLKHEVCHQEESVREADVTIFLIHELE